MSDRARRAMTIGEFLSWQSGQDRLYEFVDGEPVAMAGAKLRHDHVTVNALSEITRQLRAAGSPCDAFTADIGIRTAANRIRRPEVSILCPPFDEEAMVAENPRLILEVLSESTERVDRLVKLDEYKSLESVDYIVILDPTRIEAGFWFRDSQRGWRNTTLIAAEQALDMPALGLSLGLAALYDRVQLSPPPRPRLDWEDGEETGLPS
jgi:Uma2 family endonuclease